MVFLDNLFSAYCCRFVSQTKSSDASEDLVCSTARSTAHVLQTILDNSNVDHT